MVAIASELASRLWSHHHSTVPVNLAPLLAAERLAVVAMPLEEGLQELLIGPCRKIVVNDALGHRERRVAVAHAIGHWYLHSGSQLHLDQIDPQITPQQEHDACTFAAALLLPACILTSRLSKGETVEDIADLCQAPLWLVHEAIADLHRQPSRWTQTNSFAI